MNLVLSHNNKSNLININNVNTSKIKFVICQCCQILIFCQIKYDNNDNFGLHVKYFMVLYT